MRRLIDFIRSRVKSAVVDLAIAGRISHRTADFIVQRFGLSDA